MEGALLRLGEASANIFTGQSTAIDLGGFGHCPRCARRKESGRQEFTAVEVQLIPYDTAKMFEQTPAQRRHKVLLGLFSPGESQ